MLKKGFVVLFILSSVGIFAQHSIDRTSLRRNDKLLHQNLEYQKQNLTTVDFSTEFEQKLAKLKFINFLIKPLLISDNEYVLQSDVQTKTYSQSRSRAITYGLSSQSSGIVLPSISVMLAEAENYTLYRDHIQIAGKRYLSPLYNPKFYAISTALDNGVLKMDFEPKETRHYLLRGHLELDNASEQILKFDAQSVKAKVHFAYSARKFQTVYMPDSILSTLTIGKNQNIIYSSKSAFSEYKNLTSSVPRNSIVLDNDKYLVSEPLDSTIKNSLPSSIKNKEPQEVVDDLFLLSQGKLPILKANLLLNKLLYFNSYEGLRIGLGAETNKKFNELFSAGAFVGYGLHDKGLKAGASFNYEIDPFTETSANFKFLNTISEPGAVNFALSKKLFGNEGFRKLGLEFVQRERSVGAGISTKALKWIVAETDFSNGNIEPYFSYFYVPLGQMGNFNYSKWSSTIRLTPKEKFIKSYNRLISLGSKYPTFWYNFEVGSISNLTYTKWNFKAEKRFKFVAFGEFTMELLAGKVNKDLPYPFLYNMQGSYRPFTPIINNSFMTMGYNEFVTDRYTSLFLTHNFGRIWSNTKVFKPEFVVLHNMGTGSLSKPENHSLILAKDISKGYFESGMYFRNLITFQDMVGKTGLGVGFMYRYGAYSNGLPNNNLVIKFALDVDI